MEGRLQKRSLPAHSFQYLRNRSPQSCVSGSAYLAGGVDLPVLIRRMCNRPEFAGKD
jgi:hypothetical protein